MKTFILLAMPLALPGQVSEPPILATRSPEAARCVEIPCNRVRTWNFSKLSQPKEVFDTIANQGNFSVITPIAGQPPISMELPPSSPVVALQEAAKRLNWTLERLEVHDGSPSFISLPRNLRAFLCGQRSYKALYFKDQDSRRRAYLRSLELYEGSKFSVTAPSRTTAIVFESFNASASAKARARIQTEFAAYLINPEWLKIPTRD